MSDEKQPSEGKQKAKKKKTKVPTELRRDPTSGRWSVVQLKDADRYQACREYLDRERIEFPQEFCVFSRQFAGGKQEKQALFGLKWKGNEVEITYDNWHGDDWEVMVVQTDYPQVVPIREQVLLGEDPFVAEAGLGIHELIIEDPTEAHLPLGLMPGRRTMLLLLAMLYRLKGQVKGFKKLDWQRISSRPAMANVRPLLKSEGIRHVSFFHNHRCEAGGSQEHPHCQIIASPIIPSEVIAELEYALERRERPPRRCVYCEIVEAELAIRDGDPARSKGSSRVLFDTEHFLAVQAFSPIYPFETWLIPKEHNCSLADIGTRRRDGQKGPTELEDLASLIDIVVGRLYACLDDPAYNLIVKTEPVTRTDEAGKYASYHWHIRIEPRGTSKPAGYELSTGMFVSATPPEETAGFLRTWGHLSDLDETQPGTLNWYLLLLEAAGNAAVMDDFERIAKKTERLQKDKEDVKTELKELRKKYDANDEEDVIRKLKEDYDATKEELKELLGRSPVDGLKIPALKKLRQLLETDGATQNASGEKDEAKGEKHEEAEAILAAVSDVSATLKRIPRTLRNILQILGPATKNLRWFRKAQEKLKKLGKKNPAVFLTQVKPPPEFKQLLQEVPHAGGYEGPHYRRCPATGRWVLIPSKARRTKLKNLKENQLKKTGPDFRPKDSKEECNFCNEQKRDLNTLVAIPGTDANDSPQWKPEDGENWDDSAKWGCYMIESMYPVLQRPTDADRHRKPLIGGTGPFEQMQGVGQCDVIVVGSDSENVLKHERHNYEYCIQPESLKKVLNGVLFISKSHRQPDRCIRHITVFSNHRGEAGAKYSHVNWQIVGSPIVPNGIERELEHGRRYFHEYSMRCCFCDMIDAEKSHRQELEDEKKQEDTSIADRLGNRIVVESENFIALAPYASRSPFEVWILPIDHANHLEDSLLDEKQDPKPKLVKELAEVLSNVLTALLKCVEDPGYSMIIQNAPIVTEKNQKQHEHLYAHYHWRIVIEPQRLAIAAGYEHLTGIWSNPVAPETAVEELCKSSCLARMAVPHEGRPPNPDPPPA